MFVAAGVTTSIPEILGEVRVGVLLCIGKFHLISYYLALCVFSGWKLGERGGGEGGSVTV